MKIVIQLLKEFWLPLLLGVVWTAYNVLGNPKGHWNVRTVLNAFGPTFFFMSWLVAQWHRVKKQQNVEEGISSIQADIGAIQSPLLPCSLFYTLKHACSEEALDNTFQGCRGYKTISGSILQPLGSLHLNSAYNPIEFKAKKSHCTIRMDNPEKLKASQHVVMTPVSIDAEFFFGSNPSRLKAPSLVLSVSAASSFDLMGLELYDDVVFEDVGCKHLDIKSTSRRIWSTRDLLGAYLRVTFEFMSLRLVNEIPVENWPSLHNLQFVIGSSRIDHLLSFDLKRLSKQVVRENPNPIAHGDAKFIQIIFECDIDKVAYEECLSLVGN
jgi:hypothetical protein